MPTYNNKSPKTPTWDNGDYLEQPPYNTDDWFSVEGDLDDFIFYEPGGTYESTIGWGR